MMRADCLKCFNDFVRADGLPRARRQQDIIHRHDTGHGATEALDRKTADVTLLHRGECHMHIVVRFTGDYLRAAQLAVNNL